MNKRIKVVCSSCGHCGWVSDTPEKVASIVEAFSDTQFPCQECNGIYERALGDHPEKPASFGVTAESFWKLITGPAEQRPKSIDDVIEKMKGQTIVDVVGRMEDDRIVIEKLVLGDGRVLWLGFLRQEQIVYRMKEGQNDGECERSEG